MSKLRHKVTPIIILIIAITVMIIYLWRDGYFIRPPRNPAHSYFPSEWSEYEDTSWKRLYFQPYFVKYYINRRGQTVLKTRYRDVGGKQRDVDVFVSGEISTGISANSGFLDDRAKGPNASYILAKDNLELLKPGEQISITYLKGYNSLQSVQDYTAFDIDFCTAVPDYCTIGTLATTQSRELDTFETDGFSKNKDFIVPAFWISHEFVDEIDESSTLP